MDTTTGTQEKTVNPLPHPPLTIPAPSIYINGFAAGMSSGDVYVVLQRNGIDVGVLNFSYTVAKSLGGALTTLISSLEKRSGKTIMPSSEIFQALSKKDDSFPTTA